MVHKLYDLLACPNCKGSLDLQVLHEDQLGPIEGRLKCLGCEKGYSIKDGILYLQPDSEALGPSEGWSVDPFDSTYQAIGYHRDAYEGEAKVGIPREVTEYYYSRVKGRLLEWLETPDGSVVLDVGAGSGYFIFDMMRRHPTKRLAFVGIDASQQHIRFLEIRRREEKLTNILTVVGDARALPFKEGAFDTIVCTEVLEHIPAKRLVIGEIQVCLRDGGTLLLSTPSKAATNLWKAVEAPYRLLQKVKGIVIAYDKPLYAGQVRRFLREADFTISRFELNVILAPKGILSLLPHSLITIVLATCAFAEKHMRRFVAPFLAMHVVLEARKPVDESVSRAPINHSKVGVGQP